MFAASQTGIGTASDDRCVCGFTNDGFTDLKVWQSDNRDNTPWITDISKTSYELGNILTGNALGLCGRGIKLSESTLENPTEKIRGISYTRGTNENERVESACTDRIHKCDIYPRVSTLNLLV